MAKAELHYQQKETKKKKIKMYRTIGSINGQNKKIFLKAIKIFT